MNGTGFSRRLRLLRSADFQRVFKQPCKSVSAEFAVLAIANNLPYPRLGLAIAKKNIRQAIGRNRIKRLVREAFRKHQAELEGLDIVVMSRTGVDNKTNKHIETVLNKHWKELTKRCKSSC